MIYFKKLFLFLKSLFNKKRNLNITNYNCKVALVAYNTFIDEKVFKSNGYLAGTKTDAYNYSRLFNTLNIRLKVLGDNEATNESIIESLQGIYLRYKSVDGKKLLCFIKSSHGTQIKNIKDNDKDGKSEAFVNWNGVILDDDFNNFLKKTFDSTWDIFCIFDTCYSGGMSKVSLTNNITPKFLLTKNIKPYEINTFQLDKSEPNIKYFMAGKENETVNDLGEEKGGAFSYELFKHYNKELSYTKWFKLVSKSIKGQTPKLDNSLNSTFDNSQIIL
jgi:hypothetical protein